MSAILIVDIGSKRIKGNVLPFCEGNSNLAVITQGSGFRNVNVFSDINIAIEDIKFRVERRFPERKYRLKLTGLEFPNRIEIKEKL